MQDKPPAGDAWLHEVKFDGYRLQARISAGKVKLLTRSGLDWTERFGERIADALAALPCETALIDGEVVALGENGISSFSALQAALSEGKTANLVFFAFDLLHLDGANLQTEPLLARKEQLEELLKVADVDSPLRYSEHFLEPGQTMLRHACRMGLEGVISKRAEAPYRSGRGRDWIKSKCTQRQEFVIAGYVPSKASRNQLGSLVLGYHEDGELKPAGRVGTGFTRNSAAALKKTLDAVAAKASPFRGEAGRERGIVWVKPELVAEIAFGSWTASKTLRHSAFLGLREDKPADEVVAEKPVKAEAKKAQRATKTSRKAGPETTVTLSNPDKLLWPDIGFSKQDLLDYYARVWERMAPFVVDRPLSLLRAPDGVGGQVFFQKHAGAGLHKAVARMKDKDGEELLFIRDFDGLAALVQLGTVEVHVWGAKIDAVEMPDQIIFDLDPDKGRADGACARGGAHRTRAPRRARFRELSQDLRRQGLPCRPAAEAESGLGRGQGLRPRLRQGDGAGRAEALHRHALEKGAQGPHLHRLSQEWPRLDRDRAVLDKGAARRRGGHAGRLGAAGEGSGARCLQGAGGHEEGTA